ncbi:MAG: cupin domain-containing protein [Candidatus Binatia bacterium]
MSDHERKTPYERWLDHEGVPVIEGYGVKDLRQIALGEWKRLGCKGAYLQLKGLEGITGLFGFEIPPGKSLIPERHLYEKVLCVLSGEGRTEIEQDGRATISFEWHTGSLFSPPMNTRHRVINTGKEPALLMAVTTAPMIFDNFHNDHFIFNCDYAFSDRYDGQEGYFAPSDRRYLSSNHKQWILETNFIPDVRSIVIDPQEQKGSGVFLTQFEISENTLIGHLAEWPVGCYHKAHFHGGGAVLLILRSEGYSLMWPNEWGPQPYENGYGDRVVRVDWVPGSVFCPPTGWFHQHFNTGSEPALQLALRCGSQKYPLGIRVSHIRAGVFTSVKEGGTLIEYEDEDPAIRRIYEDTLKPKGIPCQIP